jgi:two-component system, LuxR family, response regulator FixJ
MASEMVHVIDDDEAVRDSLDFMLDAAGLKVRTWESALAFLDSLASAEHGCIVTDVRMPDMTGLELVQRLKAIGHSDPVIVITGHADVPLAVEAMKAGVVDFIEKPFDNQRLLGAVRAALARSPHASGDEGDEERRRVVERLDSLSGREREVLDGLVAGNANKVIAYDLGISPRTVEVYRANVMTKMQARSLSELVRMAIAADPSRASLR